MAQTKERKQQSLEKLRMILDKATSLVFVNFHGLKVADAALMRRALKKERVGFLVAKKTLAGLALSGKAYQGTAPELAGEFALAYGADPVAPARGVYEFQQKLKGQITIVGGVFEGRYLDQAGMTAIAAIPPLQTLYGMFVNVINSPVQGLTVVLDQIARKKTA